MCGSSKQTPAEAGWRLALLLRLALHSCDAPGFRQPSMMSLLLDGTKTPDFSAPIQQQQQQQQQCQRSQEALSGCHGSARP
eukprot:scaffold263591_cov15-Tisochrysis_lutea.AAC.1